MVEPGDVSRSSAGIAGVFCPPGNVLEVVEWKLAKSPLVQPGHNTGILANLFPGK